MDFKDQRIIEASSQKVWEHLLDPGTLKECVPGCEIFTGNISDGFETTVVQKIGPVKAKFKGTIYLSELDEHKGLRITGKGDGGIAGFVKGGADVTLGDTYANPVNGQSVEWSSWEGNRWFLTEEMSEYSFHTELLVNGEPLYINFVLACTAIQSMIIFVGAISVLDISWRKRIRALFIALSLIHILNLFRNAGLIWLQMGYPDWRWMNLTIFEFGHAYASRVVSLGAMFLLALVLFEMLPQMHRHVLSLLRPLGLEPGKKRNQS